MVYIGEIISEMQAKNIAIYFFKDIHDYVKSHPKEFDVFLSTENLKCESGVEMKQLIKQDSFQNSK